MKRILLSLSFILIAQVLAVPSALAQFSRLDEFPVFYDESQKSTNSVAEKPATVPVDVAQPAPQPAPAEAPAEFDEDVLYERDDIDHGAELSSMNNF